MMLSELKQEEKKGTYAAVRFSKESVDKIVNFAEKYKIPKILQPKDFHATLLYSEKYLPDFKPNKKYDESIKCKAKSFDVWSSCDNERKCLVVLLDCNELKKIHKDYMEEHKATYSYPEYKPHLTITYDIEDFDISKLDVKEFPEVEIVGEYQEDL